jgi:hypothetical protein
VSTIDLQGHPRNWLASRASASAQLTGNVQLVSKNDCKVSDQILTFCFSPRELVHVVLYKLGMWMIN